MNKIDCFKDLLEHNAYRLTDKSNLFDLVPFLHQQEQTQLQEKIKGKNVSVTFDGTSWLREALAIVIWCITDDWKIQQNRFVCRCLKKAYVEKS